MRNGTVDILFDSQIFNLQTHGGISRCFVELYYHLPETVNARIACKETDNSYLRNTGFRNRGYTYDHFMMKGHNRFKKFCYKIKYNFKYGKFGNWDKTPNLNAYEEERLLKKGDYDVFHPTYYDPYFLPMLKGKPFVLTVHDMIPELYPQFFAADDMQITGKRRLIPLADHIIAVSENTKRDILKFYSVPEEKITVIYHGTDLSPYVPSGDNQMGKYVLFVGARDFYKNFRAFIKEMLPSLKRHEDLSIICTGNSFSEEENVFLAGLGIDDRVKQIFVKDNQELLDLYHNAIAFIYPSEYEGFGIPILEAYKANTVVMLNKASCFPEVAGDAAIYFTLNQNNSDLEDRFEMVYNMLPAEREELQQKQRERLKLYSWDKSARQLADVYTKILSKRQ